MLHGQGTPWPTPVQDQRTGHVQSRYTLRENYPPVPEQGSAGAGHPFWYDGGEISLVKGGEFLGMPDDACSSNKYMVSQVGAT